MSNDSCPICGGTHPGYEHALVPIKYTPLVWNPIIGPGQLNYCYVCQQYHPMNTLCPKMTVTCSGDSINALPEKWEA